MGVNRGKSQFSVKSGKGRRFVALRTECEVSKAYRPGIDKGEKSFKFIGLWDTGATGTSVDKRVVQKLGLKPTGKVKVHTASGEDLVDTYIVNVVLPNNVGVSTLTVNEATLNGCDVLIGMDIISRGDFTIENKENEQVFTFSLPTPKNIAQLNRAKQPIKAGTKIGRNDPCFCGSGKKFKYCHGKK